MKNARNSSGRWASTLKTFGKKPPLKKESRHVVSVVTRSKATQTKFWDNFWNQPITSRDLNDEIMHNCTKTASSKYVANHFCKRIWKTRNHDVCVYFKMTNVFTVDNVLVLPKAKPVVKKIGATCDSRSFSFTANCAPGVNRNACDLKRYGVGYNT